MLDYIALYPNEHESELNMDFLTSAHDKPLDYFVIACMKDFESIANIEIMDYKIIEDQDDVDINNHMVNINYKKKDLSSIQIPDYKYMMESRYHEIDFKIRIHTNLNEKIIVKRILVPTEYEGYYLINNKKMRAVWQLVDASTYSRRGNVTMKSRMPILIYHTKHRVTPDIHGVEYVLPHYSYAQDSSSKKRGGAVAKKKKVKFINPLMIFAAKMGMQKALSFFGMDDIIIMKNSYDENDEEKYVIFECNEIYILAVKELFNEFEMVKMVVSMAVNLQSSDFPVTKHVLEDRDYWICRIGYLGSVKNKNIYSFYDKGIQSITMIERLLDVFSFESLRLPVVYKENIYQILYWMITNFDELKQRVNIDMANKRIRKNEVIVASTLGKKISENIHKLIERKSKSKMNTMDTLLELFNFNSDIIVTGMRNMNDIIKADDSSNDMMFMNLWSYTAKGSNSLGQLKSKICQG